MLADHKLLINIFLQAVLKQFGYSSENVITDEAELQQHQKLEKLYISTRAAKVGSFSFGFH